MKGKIELAKQLIQSAYTKHQNNLFIGYSGGKDSKVIQHLAHQISPLIISIHNSCDTEKNDYFGNVIVIKKPKSNFKEFLNLTTFTAQIDGTRKDELGKNVIFNGIDITREELNDTYNPLGVFSLEIYYPILHWTEKEIWKYIRENHLMTETEIENYIPSQPYKEIYL